MRECERVVLMSLNTVYQLFNKQHEVSVYCAVPSLKALTMFIVTAEMKEVFLIPSR